MTNIPQKRILIAEDDEDLVELLTRRCAALGFAVTPAADALTALNLMEQDTPDLAMIDVGLPKGNGLTVCEMMAAHETLRDVPMIVLTGSSSEETVRRCFQLCAYYVLKCPNVWPRIEPLLLELLVQPSETSAPEATPRGQDLAIEPAAETSEETELIDSVFAVLGAEDDEGFEDGSGAEGVRSDSPWVLSIEDDDDVAMALRLRLEAHGVTLIRATAGTEGYRKAFFSAPRAILLDHDLPGGNGDYVLRRLKETPSVSQVPVIVLTGRREGAIERKMRSLGADEFLTKPFNWNRLRQVLDYYLDLTPCEAAL